MKLTDEQKAKIEAEPNYDKALKIMHELNYYSRECDKYEYGLPMYGDRVYEQVQIILNVMNS